ncbi:MAG TPA: hypothetical protein VFE53_13960 [Mucilaginibacter sp.]|jgi:hypothetical protein|nr:hypothetical protein [Mucilaginibacter sp.]
MKRSLRKPEVRKSESPEDSLKPDPDNYRDDSPKSGEENSTISIPRSEITNSAIDISRSEIENNSDPDSYRDVNRKSEIEMEVHHHPEVEKKGLKEYILEGLMIFLAVMMGFMAENVRENITNYEHVKQLTTQLVGDLKNDTANLQENIIYERTLNRREDSLFTLLRQPLKKIDTKRMQLLISKNYNVKLFYPSLGAITAIKNELHLKQFSKSKISTYITGYEGRADVLKELENIQKSNLTNYLATFFKDHFTPVNMYALLHDQPVVNGEMRNLVQEDITKLDVEIAMIQAFNGDMISYDKKMKQDAVNLIKYIRKQYDLEDE